MGENERAKGLRVVEEGEGGLGLPTIMDRGLAQAHGVSYVHMVAFAIDLDRVRDAVEVAEHDPRWPFGFEVFLTELWLTEELDLTADTTEALLTGASSAVMEASLEVPEQLLGAQLPFAVFHGVKRGVLPAELKKLFSSWKSGPRDLVDDLDALFLACESEKPRLAQACLDAELSPPIAPPTRVVLERWARGGARDSAQDGASAATTSGGA